MPLYERKSPKYEAVEYKPGMEDGFIYLSTDKVPFVYDNSEHRSLFSRIFWNPDSLVFIITNPETGDRSVVSKEEFERDFKEVE